MSAVETAVGVTPGYVHVEKLIEPAPGLSLGNTVLKWYDIAADDAPVPLAVRALARRNLRDASKSGKLEISGDLGFVILHRCGASFYFLLVSTWRNENELWETVWAKTCDLDASFNPWPVEGAQRPTFCVWELGAVCHEQRAWSRYLRGLHATPRRGTRTSATPTTASSEAAPEALIATAGCRNRATCSAGLCAARPSTRRLRQTCSLRGPSPCLRGAPLPSPRPRR